MATRTTAAFALASLTALSPTGTAQEDQQLANPQELAAREGELLSATRQLIFEGKRSGESYFSQDGRYLVFQSEREPGNPFYQIYLMDLETGDVERVSPGMGKTTCAWIHPDNDRVMYASTHGDPESKNLQQAELDFRASGQERRYSWDYDRNFEIYAYSRKSGENTRLTYAPGYDAEGSYSPDGQWICFSSNRAAYLEPLSTEDQERFKIDQSLFLDLYIMRADGRDVRRLTFARGYDGGPFFNADGTKICWRRFNEDGTQAEIWTMDVDGSNKQQLTSIGAMSWAPYFHPSGEYLIFTTNRHGFANFELYMVDPEGAREPVRVTYTNGFDGLPVFSPDGNQLAFTSVRTADRKAQVFMADWNHDAALQKLQGSPLRSGGAVAEDEPPQSTASDQTTARITANDLKLRIAQLGSSHGTLAKEFGDTAVRLAGPTMGRAVKSSDQEAGVGVFVMPKPDSKNGGPQPILTISLPKHRPAATAVMLEVLESLFADWDAVGARRPFAIIHSQDGDGKLDPLPEAYGFAHLHIDLTGSSDTTAMQIHGVDTSDLWRREIERRNAPIGAPVQLLSRWDPGMTGDRGPDFEGFETLPHLILHEPTGTGTDHERLAKSARLIRLLVRSLLRMEGQPKFMAAPAPGTDSVRSAGKPYLGTIPAYGFSGTGVKLDGAAEGGPAHKAGLRGGDVIIALDGIPIPDLQTYAQVLETLVPGQTIKVKVERDGSEKTFDLTPGRRD